MHGGKPWNRSAKGNLSEKRVLKDIRLPDGMGASLLIPPPQAQTIAPS